MNKTIKLIAVLLFSLTINAEGQIKVDLKKKLENAVNRRANQKTDQAIDKSLDAVEEGLKGEPKKEGTAEPVSEPQKNQNDQSAGKSGEGPGNKTSGQEQTSLQTYSKYDFIPGEKVIFYRRFQPGCSR